MAYLKIGLDMSPGMSKLVLMTFHFTPAGSPNPL